MTFNLYVCSYAVESDKESCGFESMVQQEQLCGY